MDFAGISSLLLSEVRASNFGGSNCDDLCRLHCGGPIVRSVGHLCPKTFDLVLSCIVDVLNPKTAPFANELRLKGLPIWEKEIDWRNASSIMTSHKVIGHKSLRTILHCPHLMCSILPSNESHTAGYLFYISTCKTISRISLESTPCASGQNFI